MKYAHCYRAERTWGGLQSERRLSGDCHDRPDVAIIEEDLYVIPLREHVTALLSRLSEQGLRLLCKEKPQHLSVANAELLGFLAQDDEGHEFIYFASYDYPVVAPIILYQQGGETHDLPIAWNGWGDVTHSLEEVASSLVRFWHAEREPEQPRSLTIGNGESTAPLV